VVISTSEEKHELEQGDTARYGADVDHHIKNNGASQAHAILVVYTPQ
jgi:quercetin dioxygenase-like cupin family protein